MADNEYIKIKSEMDGFASLLHAQTTEYEHCFTKFGKDPWNSQDEVEDFVRELCDKEEMFLTDNEISDAAYAIRHNGKTVLKERFILSLIEVDYDD